MRGAVSFRGKTEGERRSVADDDEAHRRGSPKRDVMIEDARELAKSDERLVGKLTGGWAWPERLRGWLVTRGYRGGRTPELEKKGHSGARLRLGSGRGASRDYGESFASGR